MMFYELVLVAVLIGVSDGKIIVDDFKTMESWAVLDHFCFLPVLPGGEVDEDGKSADAGLFSYEGTMRAGSRQTIALYYDGFDAWRDIYNKTASEMTCQERYDDDDLSFSSIMLSVLTH